MKHSFYDASSGAFSPLQIDGSPALAAANTPHGMVAIAGAYSHECHRMNLSTGEVETFTPEPRAGYVWNAERRRFDVDPLEVQRQSIKSQILDLESKGHRPAREAALDPENLAARAKLQLIEDEIAALRARLAELTP